MNQSILLFMVLQSLLLGWSFRHNGIFARRLMAKSKNLQAFVLEPKEVVMPWKTYPAYPEPRIRYIARIAYDGTPFHGFQYQPHHDKSRTIQGRLCLAFEKIYHLSIMPAGASRTDTGVHSRGQVIQFDLPERFQVGIANNETKEEKSPFYIFERSMNSALPETIRLFNTSLAPQPVFHATSSAVKKLYVYRICTNHVMDPLSRYMYLHYTYPSFDLQKFDEALQIFVGTHNFSSFGSELTKVKEEYAEYNMEFSPIRTIHSIRLVKEEREGMYRVEMELKSAIYKMVRNIVGSCLEVAKGGMPFEELKFLLREGRPRRENKAAPAKPHGLCLEHVYYENY
jgi:tRNA pseudouridine38-40 synthase